MRWLLLLLLVGAGAYLYWSYGMDHPRLAACARFAELCGADNRRQCDDALDALVKVSGREALDGPLACLRKAEGCPEASGCLAGAAGKAGLKAAEQFLKGLGESLTK